MLQISLDVTVSIDDFFLRNLIENLVYILDIDISQIRIVNIIAENIVKRKRQAIETEVVTLEVGDPPKLNVSVPDVVQVGDDWEEGNGAADSVDIQVSSRCCPYTECNVL